MIALETGTEELLAQIEDDVAVLTLNRPEVRNALSDTLSPALRRTLGSLKEDRRVRGDRGGVDPPHDVDAHLDAQAVQMPHGAGDAVGPLLRVGCQRERLVSAQVVAGWRA